MLLAQLFTFYPSEVIMFRLSLCCCVFTISVGACTEQPAPSSASSNFVEAGATAGADCSGERACRGDLTCEGVPRDGSPEIGKCVDATFLDGEDARCGVRAETGEVYPECGEGLTCVGATVYGGVGFCRPHWMEGVFSLREPVAIPDGEPEGVTADLVVYGLATVPEDVVVAFEVDHPRPEDLIVTLESAHGTTAPLWEHERDGEDVLVVLDGVERDNSVNGTWKLHVIDTAEGESGTLEALELYLTSRYD
ncbi:MAG: proprotein convertase P-domain-containing protein [Myxococcota bacterium]